MDNAKMIPVITSVLHETKCRLQWCLDVVRDMLREIFDEAAYSRFLARHAIANSAPKLPGLPERGEHARERKPCCC